MKQRTRARAPASATLPDDVSGALAAALAPVAPPAARVDAMQARLLARVADDDPRFVTVRAGDGSWRALSRAASAKLLQDDGTMQSFLLRLAPGGCLPAHDHAIDELSIVLEGRCTMGELEFDVGDYHVAAAGTRHGELRSPQGCLLFVRTRSGTLPLA